MIFNAGASNNVVQGNFIGTDVSGTAKLGNNEAGVEIIDVPNNTIGGTTPAARNIISGNGHAIYTEVPIFGTQPIAIYGSGIRIDTAGQGFLTVGNNLIQRNGNLSQLGTANEDAGILVSVGGFLGVGEREVALRWNDLRVTEGGGKVTTAMTKDQLQAMTPYKYREASHRGTVFSDTSRDTAQSTYGTTGSTTAETTTTTRPGSADTTIAAGSTTRPGTAARISGSRISWPSG